MGDARYHVSFKDPATGEALGLLLGEGQLGYRRQLVNPYAAKGAQGTTQDSDLTEWSVLSQRDWRGGRGQEILEDRTAFLDAWNVETRVEGQFTLGPLPQVAAFANNPVYEPGDVTGVAFGWPGPEKSIFGGFLFGTGNALVIDSGKRWAQRFRVYGGSFDYRIDNVDVKCAKVGSPSAVLTLSIYSDDNGKPGTLLGSKSVAAADIAEKGTDPLVDRYTWENFDLASVIDVSEGYYWVVLTSTESSGRYEWDCNALNPYRNGYAMKSTDGGTKWLQPKGIDATFKVHWQPIKLEQSFTAPGAGMTSTLVQLYLKRVKNSGAVTVSLYDDSDGDPDTELKTITATISDVGNYEWVEATWASGQALTGSATYHIVVAFAAEQAAREYYALWGGAAGYASGVGQRLFVGGSWAAITEDMYFRVNRDSLNDDVVAFARYSGSWYCAAGDTVYKLAAGEWGASDQVATKDVTSLATWGGFLWAARGSANYLRKWNDSSWAPVGTITAEHLRGGGGYLQYSGTGANSHKVYYTSDGSTWSDGIEVGNGDYSITAMEWYRDMLVVATAVRLWGVIADAAYPLLDWNTQEYANNGKNMLNWSRTGCLYIPLRFGLYRWNGDTMVAVGPEQGTGLPAARAGRISSLVGTGNWLYAGIDADTTGTSSILAYNGMGGWHEVQRAEQAGQRVKALGFETISSPNRLWFGMGPETRYLILPDYSDNPWQWTGYEFNGSGSLETSWMGTELLEVVKDLHEVVVRGEGFAAAQPVQVFYEVDRAGIWIYLGEITQAPREALEFEATEATRKTVAADSTQTTIEINGETGDTDDLAQGDFVRINAEVAQVDSVTDSDTFVLATALSTAPSAGDIVYPSQAAGREFRLKLALSTTDKTMSPKITAVFVRYMNNVLDRFLWPLSVVVQDGLKDLVGNAYTYTAADLRVELDAWAGRLTPFTLVDPDLREYTVKVVSAAEGALERVGLEGQLGAYRSIYTVNLVEV